MWAEQDRYFDYVEIRRRIERRLPSGQALVVHTGLFVLALIGLIAIYGQPYNSNGVMWLNLLMGGWSGVLFLHGLWVYRNGASQSGPRLNAVRAELEERLDAGDTELITSARQAFRVSSLLDEDVRMRAGWIPSLVFAMLINCFILGTSLLARPESGGVWHMLVLLSFGYFPATYVINKARRVYREQKLRNILTLRPTSAMPSAVKQKRSFDADLERYTRLSDDGELVDAPDDWAAYERGNRG